MNKLHRPPYQIFLDSFGVGTSYRPWAVEDQARLKARLPKVMQKLLTLYGWCSFSNQVLWLCDPDEWLAIAKMWLPDVSKPELLLRSGFGDLFIHDGEVFWFINVHSATAIRTARSQDRFFTHILSDPDFATHTYLPARIERARETVGPLSWDEMYTFIPALALGGSPETSKIDRVKIFEGLLFLSALSPLRFYS